MVDSRRVEQYKCTKEAESSQDEEYANDTFINIFNTFIDMDRAGENHENNPDIVKARKRWLLSNLAT